MITIIEINRVRTILSMATIYTTGLSIPIPDTDTESDIIGMLYSSINSAPSDNLAFVM